VGEGHDIPHRAEEHPWPVSLAERRWSSTSARWRTPTRLGVGPCQAFDRHQQAVESPGGGLAADPRTPSHRWTLMFPDMHPHAGGHDHYAAYLSNSDGYELELVANQP
jgi:hypothetical protein